MWGRRRRLPDRVSSYFVPSADLGHPKQQLRDLVHDFEILQCESEWEALLTENRLIKDIKPRFNVRLTDDKTFPYLAVTMRRGLSAGVCDAERLRTPCSRGPRCIGPFTNVGALREAIGILQRVFKFRTCKLDILEGDPKNKHFRPCLLYAIGQCTAPCADKIGKEAYRADVDRFVKFLGSKRSVMLREMRGEMEAAAAALEYEKAAGIRDQISAIEKLDDRADRSDGWQPETESIIIEPEKALKSLQKTPRHGRAHPVHRVHRHRPPQGRRDGGEQGLLHRRAAVQGGVSAVQDPEHG